MPAGRMHADEIDIDASLVARLIAAQFPQWAALPIEPVDSAGTSNAIFRLGDDMAVRLPRRPGDTGQLEKERQWLPRLAPLLPLAIPVPLALGVPAEGYPIHWGIYRWLPGVTPTIEDLATSTEAATALAGFVTAFQRIDPTGGPPPAAHNYQRGVPLAMRDAPTRDAIEALRSQHDPLDTRALTEAWEAALRVPAWHGAPVWLHGDLMPSNLLMDRGRLTAVIDFGGLGIGDPACDVMPAWILFSAEARSVFRASLPVDAPTWDRGRGWALSVALIQLPYYRDTNPTLAATARRTIDEVLADHRLGA